MNIISPGALRHVVIALGGAGLVAAAAFAAPACPADPAHALLAEGKIDQARAAFEKIAAGDAKNADARYHLGKFARWRGDYSEAVKQLEAANALLPDNSDYVFELGFAYGCKADKAFGFSMFTLAKKAKACYDRAVELDPENLVAREARCNYCRNAPALAGGGMDKAYEEAEEIRKRDPIRGARALAEVYLADKKPDEALKLADATARDNPDRKPLLFWLGALAAKTGLELARGEEALREYLAYAPQSGEMKHDAAHWRLGMILEKKGDKAAARAEYEAALKLNPGFASVQEALKRLK